MIRRYALTPALDLEKFAEHIHMELDEELAGWIAELWRDWLSGLRALVLHAEGQGCAVVWLEETVAGAAEALWGRSPALGYIADALACELCMAGLRLLAPGVGERGCAALPELSESMSRLLREEGVRLNRHSRALDCRYGVITHYPYKGDCAACSLAHQCAGLRKNA